MSLQIGLREVGEVTVLDLNGLLRMGEETLNLQKCIHKLVTEEKTKFVINGDLSYIDSAGVGELVACFSTVKKNNGALKMANLSEFVHDVLRATKLLTVLDVYQTEDEALASFDD